MSRYIDAIPFAQAVSDLRNKEREKYDNLVGKHRSLARSIHGQHVEFCEKMLKTIREQPTVDAVPVVHGYNKQFKFPSQFTCSVCGWESWDTYCGDTDTFNYCPNCGARMDGKRKDGEHDGES